MKMKEHVPFEKHDQRYDEDDEGSFIEISLEAKQRCEKAENVFQFRLSFSTMLPRSSDSGGSFRHKLLMSAESVESNTSSENYTFSYDSSSVSSSSSSSSAVLGRSNARRNLDWMAFTKPEEVKSSETQNQWRKAVQFLAVRRLVKLLMLNLRSSADNTESDDTDKRMRSKASEVINSGLMKLIIKFRRMKEKSRNTLTIASNHIPGTRRVSRKTDKLSYICYESPVIEPISATERKRVNKLKLSEVSINSIKGMIDSLTVSCPASIKSSPVHRNYCGTESTVKSYSRENSIQAAIAHIECPVPENLCPGMLLCLQ